ncbi:NAD-dependent glycerol-3-phosphate dehydrogenase C-terminal domain family protein [Synechococcus sp. PCC 7335]|uniref:NAD(P)H-dependent glycerol-3-phosphate dehydrogenase n=1 Tax=Synechococcus sp. (strain ATCC 29403 / PCC 7335) TaxID=91464 RepID=UPI00017EC725|nr:NAD(P)H-dependent glycerol-3-phosphate dehydrogenase [Synechococcus sp. PCC 7335]EDX84672.1 NAD-dependent glycerol-3-phosphate dehydrogenase C-terminal domain family protein [Synechococcus sp. PCC 7335]
MLKLAVLGRGAWGSALARLAESNHHQVKLWSRRGELSLEEAIADADVILSAISMKGVTSLAQQLRQLSIPPAAILVTATKGLDPETTLTPSQIFQSAFPDHPVAVLSGPNLSKEISGGLPAATVLASKDLTAATTVQQLFSSDSFRVYTSGDPLGAELGGTLKNVMAIAVGVCDGLNLGTNAKSALITRALPEVIRVGLHLGATEVETFYGLSGLGDMLATCSSSLSRNYRVGYGLAQGKSLEQILEELGGTAEGVNTAHVLIAIANREGIPVPISRQVYRLLLGRITPKEAVEALMERELKPESCVL